MKINEKNLIFINFIHDSWWSTEIIRKCFISTVISCIKDDPWNLGKKSWKAKKNLYKSLIIVIGKINENVSFLHFQEM